MCGAIGQTKGSPKFDSKPQYPLSMENKIEAAIRDYVKKNPSSVGSDANKAKGKLNNRTYELEKIESVTATLQNQGPKDFKFKGWFKATMKEKDARTAEYTGNIIEENFDYEGTAKVTYNENNDPVVERIYDVSVSRKKRV